MDDTIEAYAIRDLSELEKDLEALIAAFHEGDKHEHLEAALRMHNRMVRLKQALPRDQHARLHRAVRRMLDEVFKVEPPPEGVNT